MALIPDHQLTKKAAEMVAQKNQACETDGWTYMAAPIPNHPRNLYKVLMRDETGTIVGFL